MARFLLWRALQAVIAMLGVSVAVFLIVHLVPGDPIRLALGTRFDESLYQAMRARAGLDQPIVVQYFRWLGRALTGDLGVSFRSGEPVTLLLLARLGPTSLLAGAALTVALAIALPLGIISAVRSGSLIDRVATAFSQLWVSVPDFWSGIMYILLFALVLGWLPASGYVSPLDDPVRALRHLVLPALTVGLISGSVLTRFVRSAVLEALHQDYARTARAKGLSRWQTVRRHVLPNAWIPIVTAVGLQLGFLLGGVVIVEVIFEWPGLGRLAYDAVVRRDYSLLQGAVLAVALMFLVVNFLVDLLYSYLDPRVRHR
ncbi:MULTISPECIES: ABC transporter permease [unclassified Solwaraspora]|uniref:ABC transporter permease n=1 Tax=unclassified Solwaraspora TaxID=2627926 RepID=UPI00259AEF7B|nr:ABC transporter permease [Solwaraspora sp. WMMA2056]WJK39559.1 ABC transporter permease [Solwaraspora sp. WMMA2056]